MKNKFIIRRIKCILILCFRRPKLRESGDLLNGVASWLVKRTPGFIARSFSSQPLLGAELSTCWEKAFWWLLDSCMESSMGFLVVLGLNSEFCACRAMLYFCPVWRFESRYCLDLLVELLLVGVIGDFSVSDEDLDVCF
jgi:hypothetical protein